MYTTWMVVAATLVAAQGLEKSGNDLAERELRKHGATFWPVGMSVTFMPETSPPYSEADIARMHKEYAKFAYVTIGSGWKGEDEHLKYLRDIPNLKDINFGNRSPES